MTVNTPTECLQAFFSFLQTSSIPYCVVGAPGKLPQVIPSDIDIIVGNNDIHHIENAIGSFAKTHNIKHIQTFQHEHTAYYLIITWLNDSNEVEYLHPDICSDYRRNGKLYLTATELLHDRIMATTEDGTKKGFFIASPDVEFIYYLIKKISKGTINNLQFNHLHKQLSNNPDGCKNKLQRFWSTTESEKISTWIRDGDLTTLREAIPQLQQSLSRNTLRPTAEYWCQDFKRKLRRVLLPTGIIIVLLGPDGCGKSTIGRRLKSDLAPAFRALSTFHLLPDLLGRKKRDNTKSVTDPHAKKARGSLASICKLFYFLLEYLVGYWVKVRPLKVRSHLIIFDRYFHDILVDPVRYRYGAPMWPARITAWFIPEPDLILILDAPAEVIQARKQEVSFSETVRQRESYLSLAQKKKNCTVINTDRDHDQVAAEALKIVFDYMEKRLQKRTGHLGKW